MYHVYEIYSCRTLAAPITIPVAPLDFKIGFFGGKSDHCVVFLFLGFKKSADFHLSVLQSFWRFLAIFAKKCTLPTEGSTFKKFFKKIYFS